MGTSSFSVVNCARGVLLTTKPSIAAVKIEYSYAFIKHLGHTGHVTVSLYFDA
jgi:hypothetical protein